MSDATQVTGSPTAGAGVSRPGDVLAERYELLELIDSDGAVIGFRALDQESERQVLVRVLAGPGLHTDVCDQVVDRLKGLVGVGGRFLSSLLDADREKRSPFTVEKWPRGTQLSSILDSRRSRGEALGPQEALPVIAQLVAALAALPEGLHHGDVRAERVWLDTDGLRLTGAFLLAVLPSDELADRIPALGPGAVAYAPESKHGMTGPASDVWGVGSIAWEALTGRSPDPSAEAPEIDGAMRAALTELLNEAPEERPASFDELLRCVAREAGLAVPNLDPEPHHPPSSIVEDIEDQGTQPSAAVRLAGREIEGAAPGGTQEIAFEDILESAPLDESLDPRLVRAALGVAMDSDSSPDDTAKHSPIVDIDSEQPIAESFDPRLVRAALGVSMESSDEKRSEPSIDALDPRLVRAALGVELDSGDSVEETLEIDSNDVPVGFEPAKPRLGSATARPLPAPKASAPAPRKGRLPAPSAKAKPSTPKLQAPAPAPKPRPKAPKPPFPGAAAKLPAPAPKPRASAPAPKPRPAAPAPKPRASAPAPKPRASAPAPRPAPGPMASPPIAAPAPRPSPAPTAPKPKPVAAPQPRPAPRFESGPPGKGADVAGLDIGLDEGTTVLGRGHQSTATPRPKKRNTTGVIIVVVALLIALGIVGLGFLIAGQRRSDAVRQRQIDERLQQLRNE